MRYYRFTRLPFHVPLKSLTLSFFLLSSFVLHAQNITIVKKNIALTQLMKEIKKQTRYNVFYPSNLLKGIQIDANFNNAPLTEVLDKVLAQRPLTYTIANKTIVIREKELTNNSTNDKLIDIKGRVVDQEGNPLVGATIAVSKTKDVHVSANLEFSLKMKVAGFTDANGYFHLKSVDAASYIFITHAGYQTTTVEATPEIGTIKMQPKTVGLQEVTVSVNTGYQSISPERSAGSYTKPDLELVKERSGSMNIVQRMDGLVPGLTINNAPNTTGSSVLLRGLTSINSNRDPLYVVNGIPVADISTINANDVEDITILKDATAASIWGAKAANGVIVITTRKGKADNKISINYDGFINFQGKPQINYYPVLTTPQLIAAAKETFDPVNNPWSTVSIPSSEGIAPVTPVEQILYNGYNGIITQSQVDQQLNELQKINNVQEIKNVWYRNAMLQNHSLSVSTGNERFRFYGSGAYTRSDMSTPGTSSEKYGLNLRQDFKFNDRIQAYLISDLQNTIATSTGAVSPTGMFLPYVSFKNANGSNADMSWLYRTDSVRNVYEEQSQVSLAYNPLNEINNTTGKNNFFYGRIVSGLTVKLIKHLRFEGVYSFTKTFEKDRLFESENSFPVRNELVSFTVAPTTDGEKPTYYLPSKGGRLTTQNSTGNNWVVRNQLIFDQSSINGKHEIIVLAGQEAQENFNNTTSSVLRGYDPQLLSYGNIDYDLLSKSTTLNTSAPGPETIYFGAPVMPLGSGSSVLSRDQYREAESSVRFTSYYANAGYTYQKKYTINASSRIDKSNLFGKDKSAQNKPVWSVGAKWNIGKENFVSDVSWLDQLSLRATYGLSGNSPKPGTASSFDILSTYYSSGYFNPSGLIISTPGNKKLSWESTKTTNIGIDFSLFQRRLSGSLDFYNKVTQNLIGFTPVNPLSGYSYIIGNLGDMNNKGIDLSLMATIIERKDFSWNVMLNLGYNKNKITKLNSLVTNLSGATGPISSAQDFITQPYLEGYSAFAIFAYRYAGLDNAGNPQIKLQDGKVTKEWNAPSIKDLKYMGTYQPKWSGGFSNMFQYRFLSLTANTIFNLGNVMRRDVNTFYSGRLPYYNANFITGNVNAEFANRWKKPGDELTTNIPSYQTQSGTEPRDNNYYILGDVNVLDASYIKLRDITLKYSFARNLVSKFKINNLAFWVQVSNIMLWKANKEGIDPEFQNSNGYNISSGADAGGRRSTPFNQKTFSVGFHLDF